MVEMNDPPIELSHHHSEAFKEQAESATPLEPAHLQETESSEPLDVYSSVGEDSSPTESSESSQEPEIAVDDYGIEIPPPRTYTQAEVEAMMRDRNSRGEFAKQQQAQQQQQTQKFEYDSSSPDSWEAQLEAFNEQWFQRREAREQQKQSLRQEQETHAAFEVRFNQSAAKYSDFEKVVVGKPLTPQMITATRGMEDPAAFIYAAAKTQAPELERISRLTDPYAQAIELGRLEERMRRSRAAVSKAPRPIDAVKGDMTERKGPKTWSIDDKLRQAEDASKKERMRGRSI